MSDEWDIFLPIIKYILFVVNCLCWWQTTTWDSYKLDIYLQFKVNYTIIGFNTIFHIKSSKTSTTHRAGDHNVKADRESFVKSPNLGAVLRLEILCKPVFRRQDDIQPKFETQRVTDRVLHPQAGGRLPEVVAFGDGVLGKRCIQSGERVSGDAVLDVCVQVTLPLNVYPYFCTLNTQEWGQRNSQFCPNMINTLLILLLYYSTLRADLVCQFSNVLPSVVQHVAHTEDGAERVFLRMVVTTLDLVPCHGGGEVPPE